MCAIFGMAGPGIQATDLLCMRELGLVASVRGLHSAGMFQTRTVGAEATWGHLEGYYKTTGPWTDLLDDLEADKKWYPHLFQSVNIDVMMAHVRMATKGAIITDNAHPFDTKHFVGAHNGTLVDHKYQHKTKTDSEMMFEDMDKQGVQKTLSLMSQGSAYAVSIYEKSTKTMLFATNGRRPLWFVNLKNRGVTYWASEPGMMTFILGRNGVAYNKPEPFPKHILARLTPNRIQANNSLSGWVEIGKLPGWYQMKEDERLLKEAEELGSKVIDAAVTVTNKSFEDKSNSQTLVMPIKGPVSNVVDIRRTPKQEQKTQKSFEGTRSESPLATFRLKCDCGKVMMNVFKSHLCRQHHPGLPKYRELTNTFECSETCKPKPAELVRA